MDFGVLPSGYNCGDFHPHFAIVEVVEATPKYVNKQIGLFLFPVKLNEQEMTSQVVLIEMQKRLQNEEQFPRN